MSNPNDYTVGWICGMRVEYVAAKMFIDEEHEVPEHISKNDSNHYTLGRIGKHSVAIATLPDGEYGAVPATSVVMSMLRSFPNIRIKVMVGIGGGAPSLDHDIRLGDIVVSEPRDGRSGVIWYDFAKTVRAGAFRHTGSNPTPSLLRTAVDGLGAQYEREEHQLEYTIRATLRRNPNLRKEYLRPNPSADKLFKAEATHDSSCTTAAVCDYDASNLILRSKRTEHEDDPAIHYGLIAFANQMMKIATLRDTLAAGNDVLCFGMKAASLMDRFPCLAICGISGYSDSHDNKEWQGYAAMAAAAYTRDLLHRIPPSAVGSERRISDILSATAQEVNIPIRTLSEDESYRIHSWLTEIDYATLQSVYLQRRFPGTGQWFLDSPEYQAWLKSSKQTMFCPGLPGGGKTILTSTVIDDLNMRFLKDHGIGIAYLYCNTWSRNGQNNEDLLASLLKQLSEGLSSLPEPVKGLYDRHKYKQTRPSLEEISSVLHSVAAMYSQIFIAVDGINEIQASHGRRTIFLSEIFSLQAKCGANLFTTSRFDPDIADNFKECTSIEICASTEDMERYVDAQLYNLPINEVRSPESQAKLRASFVKAAGGIFLFARLYVQYFWEGRARDTTRADLAGIGSWSGVYSQAYQEETISQIPDSRDLAKKVLFWVTYAKRPLTAPELQHALAVEVNSLEFDRENLLQIQDIVSACDGLVTVDVQSNTIRLAHNTLQESLERRMEKWFPHANLSMADTCVAYLSLNTFRSGACLTDKGFEDRLLLNPLYDYAANNWGHHARESSSSSWRFPYFLLSRAKVDASVQALMAINRPSSNIRDSQKIPRRMTGLHLAAYFGVSKVVSTLLRHQHDPSLKDSYDRTPLAYAAEQGHESVVKLLLELYKADVNSRDKNGWTPLSRASVNGHEAVVKLLLEAQANVDSKDECGQTSLHLAAISGYEIITEYLLKAGADIDSVDRRGSTALHESIRNDHQAVQELLIESGANLDIRDDCGETPSELAWSKKRLDLSAYELDETAVVKQGVQAQCTVLRSRHGQINPQMFTWGQSSPEVKVRRYLLREHRILQKLNHPFIVSYLGYNEDIDQQTAALYMEFCEGGDLQSRHVYNPDSDDDSDGPSPTDLNDPVPLRENEVWSIMFQLAAAMAYLHHGLAMKTDGTFSFARYWEPVIHRDIKPANVVLKAGENGRTIVKLCDLGLVKAVIGENKQTRKIGTLDYSPPEVRRRQGWTIKGDIYSLAVSIDDLHKESEPQFELRNLLDRCQSADMSARPSSLFILETAREHVPEHEKGMSASLDKLLGSGPGGYVLQSLLGIAAGLDEDAAFGDGIRSRRQKILGRLKLLCDDGAGEDFDKYSDSLHLSVLLNRQDKFKRLLAVGKGIGINKKWENSGWTSLHLAIQEDRQDMTALLLEHGADPEITDRYRRRADYYNRKKMP